jgi:hypothetical protein
MMVNFGGAGSSRYPCFARDEGLDWHSNRHHEVKAADVHHRYGVRDHPRRAGHLYWHCWAWKVDFRFGLLADRQVYLNPGARSRVCLCPGLVAVPALGVF